jgi:hypothetical protein
MGTYRRFLASLLEFPPLWAKGQLMAVTQGKWRTKYPDRTPKGQGPCGRGVTCLFLLSAECACSGNALEVGGLWPALHHRGACLAGTTHVLKDE